MRGKDLISTFKVETKIENKEELSEDGYSVLLGRDVVNSLKSKNNLKEIHYFLFPLFCDWFAR